MMTSARGNKGWHATGLSLGPKASLTIKAKAYA